MKRKEYNGYTNYETWAVSTWIGDNAGSASYWNEVAADNMRRARMYPNDTFTVSEDARIGLSETLKSKIEDTAPDLGSSMWADLLNAALSEVDWMDIADNFLSDSEGYESL